MLGHVYLNDGGSSTLISGKMGDQPSAHLAGKAMINGGINSFVIAASLEMPTQIRINAISPGKVADIPDEDLNDTYLTTIEGDNPTNFLYIRISGLQNAKRHDSCI